MGRALSWMRREVVVDLEVHGRQRRRWRWRPGHLVEGGGLAHDHLVEAQWEAAVQLLLEVRRGPLPARRGTGFGVGTSSSVVNSVKR